MKSRVLSFLIAILYLVYAYYAEGGELVLRVLGYLLLPMACIWFSDEMGSYTGVGFGRGAITQETPGCLLALGGWLLLLLPLILLIIMAIRQSGL